MVAKLRIMAVVALIGFTFTNTAFADLIFSAPPRGTEQRERTTYEPLAEAMSAVLGQKVVYEYPHNFIQYSVEMQKGKYDIVFDGPHFSQWRVENLKHKILVNLPEDLQFFVITSKDNNKVNTLHDLVYEHVCAQLTPQLGTLMLLKNYYNRAAEPRLRLVRGEDKVFSDYKAGKCGAAVLRDKTFNKLSQKQQSNYKIVFKSKAAPNDAITANEKVSLTQRKALIQLLTDPQKMQVAAPIFKRFSRNAKAFNKVNPRRYKDLDQLLLMAFGWDVGNTAINADRDRLGGNDLLGLNQ